jgi:hypothetical protein
MTMTRTVFLRSLLLILAAIALVTGLKAQSRPVSPSGLIVTSVTGTTVTLQWQAGGAVQGYVLEAGTTPGSSNVGRFFTGSPAPTVVATNVPVGTYYVRVRGVSSAGESDPSNEVTLTVGSAPPVCTAVPGAPGALTSAVSGSSVQLSWGASSGSVSTYVFEIGSTAGATNLGTIDLGTSATRYLADGVASGTYFVRVKARNPCGLSAPSNNTTVVVGSTTPSGSGPAQLQIVNTYSFVVASGQFAGRLFVLGEIRNTGGSTASMIYLASETFSPGGSRLRGQLTGIIGRSRRLTHSQEIDNATLGPGETGCFGQDLGAANTIGRYDLQTTFDTFPTAALQGQLQAAVTWGGSLFGEVPRRLSMDLTVQNVGTTPTVIHSEAYVAKDSGGRVVGCGSQRVYGRNAVVPGYGLTNAVLPGEFGFLSNQQPFVAEFVYYTSVASVSVWPQWKE